MRVHLLSQCCFVKLRLVSVKTLLRSQYYQQVTSMRVVDLRMLIQIHKNGTDLYCRWRLMSGR